jgi:protoheme IX farnesyltransferase
MSPEGGQEGVMGKLTDYANFSKLRLASLVVFSAVIGYFIACRQLGAEMSWLRLVALTLGGFLVTASSNGFNQVIERDSDKLMTRTQNRPLPAGRMTVREGLILATLMGVTGVTLLFLFTNPLSGILGTLALLLYTVVYTPLKKVTPFAVFVGAFPGAIPAMLGWVAATEGFGMIGAPAMLLFAIQFMWQFPHFWAIAWVQHEDYQRGGFHLLPSPGGRDKSSAFQAMIYALVLIPVSLAPIAFHQSGTIAAIIILICGVGFFYQALQLYRNCDVRSASRLMFGSFIYLPVVQLALLFG